MDEKGQLCRVCKFSQKGRLGYNGHLVLDLQGDGKGLGEIRSAGLWMAVEGDVAA